MRNCRDTGFICIQRGATMVEYAVAVLLFVIVGFMGTALFSREFLKERKQRSTDIVRGVEGMAPCQPGGAHPPGEGWLESDEEECL